ncbi:MAG: MFS transporter [Betaproteobacteria bacterium]|jgi:DHA1 family multidrug resistance protein-like MFS transporter|nr:MFS transporter [Betaproteobacteria bacterium]
MSLNTSDDESIRYPYWRSNRRTLPLANLICGLGFNLAWPFVPLMVRGLGVHENLETWVGYMLMVFYLISFAVSPLWGGIADHYGRKMMILRAMLGMGASMLVIPLATTPLSFAALFMLIAVFNGFTPAGVALLVANTPPHRIGGVVALAQTGGLIGQAVGPALGALLIALLDHQHRVFWISAGLMLSGGALVFLFVGEVKQLAAGPWRPRWIGGLRDLLSVPHMGLLYLLGFLFMIMWYGSVTVITVFVLQLLEAQGADPGQEAFWVGAAAMAVAIATVIALPFWGRALDHVGPRRVLVIALVATIVTHLPLLFVQTPLQLVIARAAFGLMAAAAPTAIVQLIRMHAPAGTDARAISYSTAFQFFAMGIAPFAAGFIGPVFGLRVYFALTILAMTTGLLLWLRDAARLQRR